MEPVIELKEKIGDALERRWREVLVDSIGRVGDDDKTERLLSREERRIWDAGRIAQAEYERWRYGRSGRVVATKAVLDNKRQKRG